MDYKELVTIALKKLPDSYAPYSKFHVAAALLCKDGTVYEGINIENAGYSPTNCAERTAVFKAVSEGQRDFSAIAVVGCNKSFLEEEAYQKELKIPGLAPPCGVCRQVLREFVDPKTFEIVLATSPTEYSVYTLEQLLPESFGSQSL